MEDLKKYQSSDRIVITFKEEDFKGSKFTNSFDCPLARAVTRSMNVTYVEVSTRRVWITSNDLYEQDRELVIEGNFAQGQCDSAKNRSKLNKYLPWLFKAPQVSLVFTN